MAISPRELRSLAERSTINADDQMKIATLSSVLGIAQQIATEILSGGDDAIPPELVPQAYPPPPVQRLLRNRRGLEGQEEVMRARAQHLRQRADGL